MEGLLAILILLLVIGGMMRARVTIDDHVDEAIEEGKPAEVVGWGCGGIALLILVGIAAFALAGVLISGMPEP